MKLSNPPSVVDTEAIANIGAGSSFSIVPVAVPLVVLMIAPLVGVLRVAVKVSLLSNNVSSVVGTEKVLVVSPCAKDRVSVLEVKSLVLMTLSVVPMEAVTVTR